MIFNHVIKQGVVEQVELEKYFFDYKIAHPEVLIRVGTDSKQAGSKTNYVTTVCFVHPSKGVHIIYKKVVAERVKDIYTRLFKEAELSVEVVDYLKGKNYIIIHLDYSPTKLLKSASTCDAVMGWLKSAGYTVACKPDAFAASSAADAILKKSPTSRKNPHQIKKKTRKSK
jgi:uncharacterized protein